MELALSMVGLTDRMAYYPSWSCPGVSSNAWQSPAHLLPIRSSWLRMNLLAILTGSSADDILAHARSPEQGDGKTIIMVTHDPHAAQSAHSIRYLEKGELDVTPEHKRWKARSPLFFRRFFLFLPARVRRNCYKNAFPEAYLRNTLRHKLRTGLTVLGLVVAILAFGLLTDRR